MYRMASSQDCSKDQNLWQRTCKFKNNTLMPKNETWSVGLWDLCRACAGISFIRNDVIQETRNSDRDNFGAKQSVAGSYTVDKVEVEVRTRIFDSSKFLVTVHKLHPNHLYMHRVVIKEPLTYPASD
ncbi:hypothetical protein M747DRAFT_69968 [Aspergillus niger ATCC 13496]|uniref:Uncharacterized protein n=1 Tax=Aspergillus niger ATCC 13496 TaxID=1353008 RepID=A0A370BTY9_ASPNG|nr:hypothetical protein M747DRAFT_69968 [Aspergillus niger ATCC 13496]